VNTRKRLETHDIAVYLRVRGENAKEVDDLVWRFCEEVKKKLGRRLVIKGSEVDK
jgi:hypothetical protein